MLLLYSEANIFCELSLIYHQDSITERYNNLWDNKTQKVKVQKEI